MKIRILAKFLRILKKHTFENHYSVNERLKPYLFVYGQSLVYH